MSRNQKVGLILNTAISVFMIIGVLIMFTRKPDDNAMLTSVGIENLKYYTVLSNIFCGIVAVIYIIFACFNKETAVLVPFKLASVCAVTVTFSVVAFFFGPLYGYLNLYRGYNLYFHLLEPVTAIAEFVIIRRGTIPFRHAVLAGIPTLLYGAFYLGNLLINGIGGPWPDTNDFYGFVNWGYPVGILIFAVITLVSFVLGLIFRAINNKAERKADGRI